MPTPPELERRSQIIIRLNHKYRHNRIKSRILIFLAWLFFAFTLIYCINLYMAAMADYEYKHRWEHTMKGGYHHANR